VLVGDLFVWGLCFWGLGWGVVCVVVGGVVLCGGGGCGGGCCLVVVLFLPKTQKPLQRLAWELQAFLFNQRI